MSRERLQTGRNPFARVTIRKRGVAGTCAWCGHSRHGRVFVYVVDADNPRESGDIRGEFCGVACLNAYHR